MKDYVLLQAPKQDEEYYARIEIVGTKSATDKLKYADLVEQGYTVVGKITSDLATYILKRGFCYDVDKRIEAGQAILKKINNLSSNLEF